MSVSCRFGSLSRGFSGYGQKVQVLMGFTKLDERILQSSIMAEDAYTFKIWIALLAACKEDGISECSPIYLSAICRIDIETVNKSLSILMSPDKNSRSLNDDGIRIRRIDGGFEIINYKKYRDFSLRSAEAERKRLYRSKNKECPDILGQCPDTLGIPQPFWIAVLEVHPFSFLWRFLIHRIFGYISPVGGFMPPPVFF